MPNQLLSEIRFGAFLAYSPRGKSDVSKRSRRFCKGIKHVDPSIMTMVLDRLAKDLGASEELKAILDAESILVPTPRSAPLVSPAALWPAREICEGLVERGIGRRVAPCLERARSVRKSAFQGPGERPSAVEQMEAMVVTDIATIGERMVLVDDVVTKGCTILGAASLLQSVASTARISAFALVRTMGLVPEVERIVEPCLGMIKHQGDYAWREP